MNAYVISCIVVSSLTAIALGVSHSKYKNSTRMALGVLVLCTVLSPLISAAFNFTDEIQGPPSFDENVSDGEYSAALEKSFKMGITYALSEKFSLSEEHIFIMCDGFEYEKMRAEKIYITLSKDALLGDYISLRQYVLDNFVLEGGKCEVNFEIGKNQG